jgi:hypothetical protein
MCQNLGQIIATTTTATQLDESQLCVLYEKCGQCPVCRVVGRYIYIIHARYAAISRGLLWGISPDPRLAVVEHAEGTIDSSGTHFVIQSSMENMSARELRHIASLCNIHIFLSLVYSNRRDRGQNEKGTLGPFFLDQRLNQ